MQQIATPTYRSKEKDMANCIHCGEYVIDDETAGMTDDGTFRLFHPNCELDWNNFVAIVGEARSTFAYDVVEQDDDGEIYSITSFATPEQAEAFIEKSDGQLDLYVIHNPK